MASKTIPVVEIFGPTIQGEGYLAGRRTMFIRTGYCDGGGQEGWCKWCDTMYAVNPIFKDAWTKMTPEDILQRLRQLSSYCNNVSITGGNPAIHNLTELMHLLRRERYIVNVETQGTIFRDWLQYADIVTISPKPPSAGVTADLKRLARVVDFLGMPDRVSARPVVVLKIAVDPDSPHDYQFARRVMQLHSPTWPKRYITCLTKSTDSLYDVVERYRKLVSRINQDPEFWDVAILPQLHVLIWGHRSGV